MSLSVLIDNDFLPSSDLLSRYVATHAYSSTQSGVLSLQIHDDGSLVRLAQPVPLDTCDADRLRTTLDALVDAADDIWMELPRWGDPLDVAPACAWLVFGKDEPSLSPDALDGFRRDELHRGCYTLSWTSSSKAKHGDLLLFYTVGNDKAVRYVARAVGDAYFVSDAQVDGLAPAQWVIGCTPPIAIEPISLETLREVHGPNLILKGRSGKYLRPEVVDRLDFQAVRDEDDFDVELVVVTPVGLGDLPDPATLSFDEWRELAAGALDLEEQVSEYIVEPFFRLVGGDTDVEAQATIPGAGVADYVLRSGRDIRVVVEVKQAIDVGKDHRLSKSKAFEQILRYQSGLGVPGILIDASSVVLLAEDGTIVHQFERVDAVADDLEQVRRHIGDGE